jgi:hypothetical protein
MRMILLMSKQLRNTLVLERVTVDELNRHPSLCCLRVESTKHHRTIIDLAQRLSEYGGAHARVLELMPMGKTTIRERKMKHLPQPPSGSAPLLVS